MTENDKQEIMRRSANKIYLMKALSTSSPKKIKIHSNKGKGVLRWRLRWWRNVFGFRARKLKTDIRGILQTWKTSQLGDTRSQEEGLRTFRRINDEDQTI